MVASVGVEPFIVTGDGLGFLLLVGQRRDAAESVDVVEVHGADLLLGVLR